MGGETQLGQTTTPLVAPTCPANVSSSNCTIILTRVTAIETMRDGIAYPTRVKKAGVITSFTVGLSQQGQRLFELQFLAVQLDVDRGAELLEKARPRRRSDRAEVGQDALFRLGQLVRPELASLLDRVPVFGRVGIGVEPGRLLVA